MINLDDYDFEIHPLVDNIIIGNLLGFSCDILTKGRVYRFKFSNRMKNKYHIENIYNILKALQPNLLGKNKLNIEGDLI
jgi:hypothetical protein